MSDFVTNENPSFFPMALKSTEIGELSVSGRKAITVKTDVLMSVTQTKIKKRKCGKFLKYPRIITE
jgi:hypothetical protein